MGRVNQNPASSCEAHARQGRHCAAKFPVVLYLAVRGFPILEVDQRIGRAITHGNDFCAIDAELQVKELHPCTDSFAQWWELSKISCQNDRKAQWRPLRQTAGILHNHQVSHASIRRSNGRRIAQPAGGEQHLKLLSREATAGHCQHPRAARPKALEHATEVAAAHRNIVGANEESIHRDGQSIADRQQEHLTRRKRYLLKNRP